MHHKFYGSLYVIKKLVLIIFYVKKECSHVSFLQKGWRFWQRHTCGPSKKIREKVCRIEYEFSKDIWGYSLEGNIQKKSRKVEKEERKVANHFPPPLVVKKWVGEQKSTTSHKNHSKSHEIFPPFPTFLAKTTCYHDNSFGPFPLVLRQMGNFMPHPLHFGAKMGLNIHKCTPSLSISEKMNLSSVLVGSS